MVLSILLAMALSLCACGGMPNLSEEQEEMVSEYATALLLKYDSENHSRLVDTTDFKEEYETAVATYEAEKQAYLDAKQKEEDKRKQETLAQENANSSAASSKPSNDGTGGATVIDKTDVETVLELKGFSFDCTRFEVTDVYPKSQEDLILTISGTKTSDLLIIYIEVTNNNSQAQSVDFAGMDNPFKISVNGEGYRSALSSFVLDDDITTFSGTINSGETKKLVLISEVKKGSEVNKLNLRVVYKDKSATRVLK